MSSVYTALLNLGEMPFEIFASEPIAILWERGSLIFKLCFFSVPNSGRVRRPLEQRPPSGGSLPVLEMLLLQGADVPGPPGRLYFCAHHFWPKRKMVTFPRAHSHALTNATRRHEYF